ncbi:MAG: phosphotransferase [Legionella sp.]|nr:phosphotransferase [Legionella sp.]
MSGIKHWSAPFFTSDILEILPLKKGLHHQLELIHLVDNSYWVGKKFSEHNWLGPTNFNQLVATENMATVIADKLAITCAALKKEGNNAVLQIDDQYAVIRPYYYGQSYSRLSIVQAEILGTLLAKIHCLKLHHSALKPFPKITDITCPPWLTDIAMQCNASITYRTDLWVGAHRDTHMDNFIWQDKKSVHLIDWESAGMIHPGVELAGLASNCAGIETCQFDENLFAATLRGYKAHTLHLPPMDETLWVQTWHSWLLWYAFLEHQEGLQIDKTNTMNILKFKQQIQPKIQQLYFSQITGI